MSAPARDIRPVIGLTTYLERAQQGVWDVRAAFLPQVYLDATTAVGGAGVLLPPQPDPDAAADAVLDGLDGLVLTGGLDVDPALYGAAPHPETDEPLTDRVAWELGICRGLQLANVAAGGTLHQHLPEALGTRRYQLGGGVFATNTATVEDGTRLADIVGAGDLSVRSYHHQGIDRVGDGLVVSARSDDGLPQAIETIEGPWFVAVQWHPEEDAADRRLFAALVAAARRFRAAR